MSVTATLALKTEQIGTVGAERIALLEAVAREGSISAAARSIGLSYKAAWDGLAAMQNLVSQPLLEKNTGGRRGGGAKLTSAGLKLIETFHRLEAGLATMLAQASDDLDSIGLTSAGLLQGFMMRTSARNILTGQIEMIMDDGVATLLHIRISPDIMIKAQITAKSMQTLGLIEGRSVAVLIKAPFISIMRHGTASLHSTDNHITGHVHHINTGERTSEVIINIGNGKALVTSLDKTTATALNLQIDDQVTAIFNPNHIIIATP